MDRRSFLANLAAGAGLGAAPALADAAMPASDVAAAFDAALRERPWLVGFQSAAADRPVERLAVEGRWPAVLEGSLYRNGPAKHDRAGLRYHHWFDGDGMVHRWRVADGAVDYAARFVRSDKFRHEEEAGRFLFDAGGTRIPGSRAVTRPDAVNVANTSLLKVGDALWALWEGGSPTALDPGTLNTRGLVTLAEPLKGAPFSAHPRVGADGRIWNIGTFGTKLAMYRLSAAGRLEQFRIIDIPPVVMMHDFFLTERSVVLLLPSADDGGRGEGFFGQVRPRPDLPMQLIVADREMLQVTRRAELPSGYWFHGGNAWEEGDGTLRFDVSLLPDASIVQGFRAFMRGDTARPTAQRAVTTLFTVAPDGRVRSEPTAGDGEFPRIDPRAATRRNRFVFTLEKHGAASHWYDAVRRIDVDSGRIDRFHYGAEHLVEEHVFVPRPGDAEGDGWLVGTTLHWPSRRTCLNLLDARRLADGPIARAWAPVPAPLGFHGQWA